VVCFCPSVLRSAIILLLIAGAASAHAPRQGSPDAVFAGLPFDEWLKRPDASHLRWTANVAEPFLSAHQRLIARLYIEVDGRELARRRGNGTLLVLVQVDDQHGRVWQNHQEMDLGKLEEGIKANDALFGQAFFVLPGDYRVAMALYDTATHEHALRTKNLHVSRLRNDPLPESWQDLPAVEFTGPTSPPDGWFLPQIRSSLHLTAEPREPARISLLVNLTPSERLTGSARVQNRNFSSLLPAAKLLSAVAWGASPFHVELADLARRKVVYEDSDAGIDWLRASAGLAAVNPGLIDVNSLQNRWYAAQFFLDEVARQLSGGSQKKILIVLSSAVEFTGGQDTRPVAPELAANTTIYYIRYQPFVYPSRRPRDGPPRPQPFPPVDQLAALLRPLNPRLYDAATPEQFRKVLATVLADISRQ